MRVAPFGTEKNSARNFFRCQVTGSRSKVHGYKVQDNGLLAFPKVTVFSNGLTTTRLYLSQFVQRVVQPRIAHRKVVLIGYYIGNRKKRKNVGAHIDGDTNADGYPSANRGGSPTAPTTSASTNTAATTPTRTASTRSTPTGTSPSGTTPTAPTSCPSSP